MSRIADNHRDDWPDNFREDWGMIKSVVLDMHAMHKGGGCTSVKLLQNSLKNMVWVGTIVAGAYCGWLGFLTVLFVK